MWTFLEEGFITRPKEFGRLTLVEVKLFLRKMTEHSELEAKNRQIQQRYANRQKNSGGTTVVRIPRFNKFR